MAKSIRASSHLNAKAIKRKGVFQKTVDARAARVAEKLKNDLLKQKLDDLKAKNNGMEVDEETLLQQERLQKEEKLESGEDSEKKVSTSGWRDARHHNYKKARLQKNKNKKGSFTKF
ncbi:uncharacterized protein KLLA0_E12431g [Kluyveromyces lactis]|uniref:KLLA0E12431p n=1 Tax=Kluyveromyces lactis (strain ATCC 8585 / CBS 2359 / DSM 70799 / NBRC 1267 / NRRL Y-1140 / WM37) TaxID=284590 RepID=Q6CNI0_KLULA|nr:uncharacterized protein KLLA0_E12431g [Kluyveromyces lactis]CAG99596.1 KLLA0E12431p [Kluyveromyces lactis]|eukprot:XP_454509.1 uncharacterized protein KLLA0_E12431g [Kluyveromyces lactis]